MGGQHVEKRIKSCVGELCADRDMATKSNEQIYTGEEKALDGYQSAVVEPTIEALRAYLHLANMQFSSRLTTALLVHFKHNSQALFAASDRDLDEVPGLQARHVVRMRD